MDKWPNFQTLTFKEFPFPVDRYIEYVDGNKQGFGVLNFENNGGYEGEFVTGCISGLGAFYFKDGRSQYVQIS